MARLFTSGFEIRRQSTTEAIHAESNAAGLLMDHTGFTYFDTTNQRSGAACYGCAQGCYAQIHNVVTTFSRIYYHRGYFKFSDATPSAALDFMVQEVNGQECAILRLNTNGTVTAHDYAGTQKGSPTAALTSNVYYRFEMRFVLPSSAQTTTGQLRTRLNGTDFCNVTSANFGGVHISPANGHVKMGHVDNTVTGCTVYLDDVAINDSTGPVGNQESWAGPGRVLLSRPVSDNAIGVTWKNSVTGGLWTSVDNTPPLGDPHPEEPPPPPTGAHGTDQTLLWVGSHKIITQNQDSYFDAGFTSIIYTIRSIIGGSANAYAWELDELIANAQGHDFSDCYVSFWLDTDVAGPILNPTWHDPQWETNVFPKLDTFIDRVMNAGFKGITFDQELYSPNTPQPYGWEWDYTAGYTEANMRAKVRERGEAFGAHIVQQHGDIPVNIYHFAFPGDTHYGGAAQGHKDSVDDGVYGDWMNGLLDGGLNIQLLDSNFYKDMGFQPGSSTNAADWTAAFNYEVNTAESLWGENLANTFTPFVWLTDGPLATKATLDGLSDANIWDRQRSDAHITAQISGLRNAPTNLTDNLCVYAYNLVGGAAQYDAMPGFPGI